MENLILRSVEGHEGTNIWSDLSKYATHLEFFAEMLNDRRLQ